MVVGSLGLEAQGDSRLATLNLRLKLGISSVVLCTSRPCVPDGLHFPRRLISGEPEPLELTKP